METGQDQSPDPAPDKGPGDRPSGWERLMRFLLGDATPRKETGDHRLTGRQRVLRLLLGAGLVALGCGIFTTSKALDPANRAGILGIAAVVFGLIYVGQGLRGRLESPIHREEAPPGPPIPVETMSLGVFAGWLVPGAAHWIAGRRSKAILFFSVITITFWVGVALAHGRNLSYERDSVYFYAYVFNGLNTLVGWLATAHLELDHPIRFLQVGYLYTAVASLLNLVALMDFVATCLRSHESAAAANEATGAGEETGGAS